MSKKTKTKSRKLCLIASSAVLLISLSSCSTAGKPVGKLDVNATYVEAGKYKVTYGELWNELKWNANEVLTDKIDEVVMKDYYHKVELVVEKNYSDLTSDEKKEIADDLNEETFGALKTKYLNRLEDYVIEDIYNFSFDLKDSYEAIKDVSKYDAKKNILTYADELYTNYNLTAINNQTIVDLCTQAAENEEHRSNYLLLADKLKEVYYHSLAKELLAYHKLEEDIDDAYKNRDTENEDDLGYFKKSDYTSKFKSDFANQADLNVLLIHFSSEDEYSSTLRAFGLKKYDNKLVYIPRKADQSFKDYCKYYDDLTTSDLEKPAVSQDLSQLIIAQVYIQMYNYLYGGYRDYIYDNSYEHSFDKVENLINITANIIEQVQKLDDEKQKEELQRIAEVLKISEYDVDTIYTRKEIDDIASALSTYLYDTLCVPYETDDDPEDDRLCYSSNVQTFNGTYWAAFKFGQGEEKYKDIYDKNTVDDDLFDSIEKDDELKKAIEEKLKDDKITSSAISTALKERTDEVKVSIYDEALEIQYATKNSNYSKTYGKAPNSNVIATLKFNKKTWNLNIVEDKNDEKALNGGVYNILEAKTGVTTAIDLLSKKVVKDTKAYKDTAKDIDDYKKTIEYVLAAFSNDYYSSSGYSSSIGKYNFMMLYFHSANINNIVSDIYRVNGAASKLLTNYNSNELLSFFKSYSDNIHNNYFSISGKRLVVYLDADDDSKKDDVSTWKDYQKTLAKDLIHKIYTEVASTTGSHESALTNIVSEINGSARAKFENNPIAAENKWAEYRKAGLNVEYVEIDATNDTTSIDFVLKDRMYDIFHDKDYSINETTPTEYIEDLQDADIHPEKILETKDGYNLLLITSATFQKSAEFKEKDDPLKVYEDMEVYYNEEYHKIGNIYNDDKLLSIEQIRLYVLEYVSNSTSDLTPSALSEAISAYLSPVLTRYTANETQREILKYFIETKVGTINFGDNNERFEKVIEINHNNADSYLSVYYDEDTYDSLKTYENWWTDLQEIVSKILLTEGDNE